MLQFDDDPQNRKSGVFQDDDMDFGGGSLLEPSSLTHKPGMPMNEEDLLLDNFYIKKTKSEEAAVTKPSPLSYMNMHMDMSAAYLPPEPATIKKSNSDSTATEAGYDLFVS